jgi:hypothetical protein
MYFGTIACLLLPDGLLLQSTEWMKSNENSGTHAYDLGILLYKLLFICTYFSMPFQPHVDTQ